MILGISRGTGHSGGVRDRRPRVDIYDDGCDESKREERGDSKWFRLRRELLLCTLARVLPDLCGVNARDRDCNEVMPDW